MFTSQILTNSRGDTQLVSQHKAQTRASGPTSWRLSTNVKVESFPADSLNLFQRFPGITIWWHFLSTVQRLTLWYKHQENPWPHSHTPRRSPRTQPSALPAVHTWGVLRCLPGSCPHVCVHAGFPHTASFLWSGPYNVLHKTSWEARGWLLVAESWNRLVLVKPDGQN